jgi:hypothetical protein
MDHPAAPRSLLRSFERHLRAQNRSERTVGNYLESARLADAFLEGRGKRLEQATQADLEDFVAHILRRRSASTNALACRRGSTRANRPATRAGNSSSPTCQQAGDTQGGPGCAKGITRISLCQPDTRSLVRWLAPPGRPQSRPRRWAIDPAGDAELGEDVGDVYAGGLGPDEQRLGDLAVAAAVGDQGKRLPVPRGQAELVEARRMASRAGCGS